MNTFTVFSSWRFLATLPRATLIGRPNCGKSAIWNRLIAGRQAIVSPVAGTTRDRREGRAQLGELAFTLVDTGGLEDAAGEISSAMRIQAGFAIAESDLVLFCIDAKQGVTLDDEHYARWVRKQAAGKKVVLLANKCEGLTPASERWDELLAQCRRLGFGDPVVFSAAQGEGLGDLFGALQALPPPEPEAEVPEQGRALCLAILGRPNVGKSSLLNALVGRQRVLTSPVAGTTRDAVHVEWTYEGRTVRLVDTAGLRGGAQALLYQASKRARAKVHASPEAEVGLIEGLAAQASLRALEQAHVVCVVVDLTEAGSGKLAASDVQLVERVHDAGKALLVVANKADRVRVLGAQDKQQELVAQWLRDELARAVPQLQAVPVLVCSASRGEGVDKIMPTVCELEAKWSSRVATSAFIRWIRKLTSDMPPPAMPVVRHDKQRAPKAASVPVKIKFASQVSTRPPTFALWVNRNRPEQALSQQYLRFLTKRIRTDFNLEGVPIRLLLRSSANPFVRGSFGSKHKRLVEVVEEKGEKATM